MAPPLRSGRGFAGLPPMARWWQKVCRRIWT